ncbi:Phosphatidyl-myo-inositol mannosyltransferase [Planctomycetaceae bacterium]|nr:Phosphatidyl-myo-inositol mannosyltransferase [Planctomycetaceae bacterium]
MTDLRVIHVIARLTRDQGGRTSTLQGMCSALALAGATCTVASVGEGEHIEEAEVLRFEPGRPRRFAASPRLNAWLGENATHFDAVIAHGMWLSPTRYAYHAAKEAGLPFFLRPAGMLDPDALAHHPLRKTLRWWLGERGMVRRANLLFSTDEDRDRAMKASRLDASRCHVVPNPVRENFFEVTRRPAQPPLVLCLNRLHPRKGVLQWVEALELFNARHLSYEAVHAGPEEDMQYAAACRRADKSRSVRWEGVVSGSRVRQWLEQAAVLVHPSVGFENFGMVIAEAMAAGVPVVASRRALLVPQLERAALVEAVEPTPQEIAQALQRVLTSETAARQKAARAREYARKHFSLEVVGKQLAALLKAGRG